MGIVTADGDTVFQEKLRIQTVHGHVVYIATVGKQQPILFSLKPGAENVWRFENLEHDFPQSITYTKTGKDSLEVDVAGVNNGQEVSDHYAFKRVK